jgi:hypothetical protein
MDLQLEGRWLAGNHELDPRLLPLLRAVARSGSLNRAVASLKLSYRGVCSARRSAFWTSRSWSSSAGVARA